MPGKVARGSPHTGKEIAVTNRPGFPIQQFYDLLLDGTRRSLQHLKHHYHNEHIYRYVLLLSAAYDIIQPGINTEEALLREVEWMSRALAARNREASFEDVCKVLRYSAPEQAYRVQIQDYNTLATANVLLTELGKQYLQALENPEEISVDEEGVITAKTPYDDLLDNVHEILREALRALDREGLFGEGETRDQIVLDLHWFEGDAPYAYFYAVGLGKTPPSPLNPPTVQTRYEKALIEQADISRILFGG